MSHMKIYCIIVTYNAIKWIDKCLNSVCNSTVKANTVVVDNCSKDDTLSHIRKQYPWVDIIENSENRGFGQANNQGIEYAYKRGATHFFLLNQDAYLFQDALSILAEIQDKYNLDVVSPIHLNGLGTKMDSGFFFICRSVMGYGLAVMGYGLVGVIQSNTFGLTS